MSRKKRRFTRRFKVFCEGDTEYNYFEFIRKNKLISLALTPVNMFGGGYRNFLDEIKKDSNTDCLAKFIVIDGDRAMASEEERKSLGELVDYCIGQNSSKRIPHVLIIDSPDFEYVACLHCEDYNGGSVEKFITEKMKYRSIDAFKSDINVYKKLNNKKNTYKNVKLKDAKKNCIIKNQFKITKVTFEIWVNTIFLKENIGKKGTNFFDFIEIIDSL